MTDAKKTPPSGEPDPSPLYVEAEKLLQEIKQLREQAESQAKQAEIARKNADSEALLASNAKKYCEEHATAVSGVKGTVEIDATAIATNKQRADEALAAMNTARANADGELKAIDGKRKEIDQAASNVDHAANGIVKAAEVGSNKLKEIDTLKEAAETSLKAVTDAAKSYAEAADASAKNASTSASQADSAQKEVEKLSSEAAELVGQISEHQKVANQRTDDTGVLLAQAKSDEEGLKAVLDHLTKSDAISTSHEKRVQELTGQLETLIKRVESLLPGAASAGLASSFNKQKSRFVEPQKLWLRTFVLCILGLVALGAPSFVAALGLTWFGHPDQTWNGAWRSFAFRLPILFPIVWLAIYAGRNYMMSIRMEEDYAYKEAISTAFEGYKREMEKITVSDGDNPTPITILCTNILRAIAERPGRIYEGKQRDLNLMSEIQGMVEKSAELSKKKLAAS
jgi:hypothetical protein